VQFAAAYVATIKPRNDNEFTSMSEQAGAPPGRERGMITAGARFTPLKALSFGAITYYVPDTLNIFYTEGNYTWPLTEKLALKLQGQFTEQGSVGGDNLIGSFHTRVGGAQASLSYGNAVLRAAFSITANAQNITSPYGTYPGYLSSIEKDFNRAGERAWLLGFSYDLKDYVKGLSLTFNFARGTDTVDPATKSGLPDENETDITVDYRIEQGLLRGMWVRVRNGYVDFSNGGGSSNNVRLIINYGRSRSQRWRRSFRRARERERVIFSRVTPVASLLPPQSVMTAEVWRGYSPPESFQADPQPRGPAQKAATLRSLPGVWPLALLP
jgi:hypothetical protein